MPAMRSRISSSSSTIRISDAICDPFLLIALSLGLGVLLSRREDQNDLRAMLNVPIIGGIPTMRAVARILQDQFAAMVFQNLAHDREAETCALGSRRYIGLGQPVAMFVRQADAVVCDSKDDALVSLFQRDHDTSGRVVALGETRIDALA